MRLFGDWIWKAIVFESSFAAIPNASDQSYMYMLQKPALLIILETFSLLLDGVADWYYIFYAVLEIWANAAGPVIPDPSWSYKIFQKLRNKNALEWFFCWFYPFYSKYKFKKLFGP